MPVTKDCFVSPSNNCSKMALKSKVPDLSIPENLSWPEFVFQDFKSYGDRTALACGTLNYCFTFCEVLNLSRKIASALNKKGITKGDVVAMLIPNAPEFAVILFGVLQAGGVVTGVNPHFTTEELTNQLREAKAQWIFASKQLIHRAKESAQSLGIKHVFVHGEDEECESVSALFEDDGSSFPSVKFNPKEDLAILPFSSGVSGISKCVMLTHFNLVSLGCIACAKGFLDFTETSIILADVPFYRVFGMIGVLSLGLYRGSPVLSVPRFDQNKFFHLLQDNEVTHLCTDASHANLLSSHPAVDNFDLTSLTEVMTTSTTFSEAVSRNMKNRIPQLRRINQCYGMTETGAISHMSPSVDNKHGSLGVLLPNLECKVIDKTTGKELGTGKQGEICVRGPTVMKGYSNNQAATAQVIDSDGWIHTGDIGYYDNDEHFYIVDKLKALIKFKGHQVPAAELESVLRSHPAIEDAAVIGVPDPEVGELPMAYVVSKNEEELTDIEIMEFMDENVAPHKRLRGGVEFIAAIPRSADGDVLRSELKERAKKRKPYVRLRRQSSFQSANEDRRFSVRRVSIRPPVKKVETSALEEEKAQSRNVPRSSSCVII